MFLDVPTSVWVFTVIIIVVVTWLTIWVTNKAYSKKWDSSDTDSDKLR